VKLYPGVPRSQWLKDSKAINRLRSSAYVNYFQCSCITLVRVKTKYLLFSPQTRAIRLKTDQFQLVVIDRSWRALIITNYVQNTSLYIVFGAFCAPRQHVERCPRCEKDNQDYSARSNWIELQYFCIHQKGRLLKPYIIAGRIWRSQIWPNLVKLWHRLVYNWPCQRSAFLRPEEASTFKVMSREDVLYIGNAGTRFIIRINCEKLMEKYQNMVLLLLIKYINIASI
jgi:hypothetical protein